MQQYNIFDWYYSVCRYSDYTIIKVYTALVDTVTVLLESFSLDINFCT